MEGIRRVERILGSVCPRIERTNVQAGYGAMRIAIATHNGTAVHTFFELCTSTIGSGSSEDDEGAIPLTTVAGPDVMSEDALVLRLIDEMFSCQQQQQQQPDDHDGVADAETETAYDDDEGVLFRLMQGNLRVLDLGFGIDSGKNISNYLGRNVSDFYSSRRPNSRTAEEMVAVWRQELVHGTKSPQIWSKYSQQAEDAVESLCAFQRGCSEFMRMLTGANGEPNSTQQAAVADLLRWPIGLVHGDLHGENILCDGHNLFLIDFAASCDRYILADMIRLETNVAVKVSLADDPLAFEEILSCCLDEWCGGLPQPTPIVITSGQGGPCCEVEPRGSAEPESAATEPPPPAPASAGNSLQSQTVQTACANRVVVARASKLVHHLGQHRRQITRWACGQLNVEASAARIQETL